MISLAKSCSAKPTTNPTIPNPAKTVVTSIPYTVNIARIVKIIIDTILLLVITFSYGNKIDKLNATIEKQNKKIEECSYEIKRLKLVEQDYETDKEYIYQCFKEIEQKAERSGK